MHNFLRKTANLIRFNLLVLAGLVTLVGCGSNSNSSAPESASAEGVAVKGIISNAPIRAYRLMPDGERTLVSQTRTNSSGQFRISIPKEHNSSPLLLILSADQQSTMQCDVSAGCVSASGASAVPFGQPVPLDDTFRLFGILDPEGSNPRANISPLSHITVTTAQNLPDGLTAENLDIARQWVADAFDLAPDFLSISPIDLTTLNQTNPASDRALLTSLYGAAFYDLTQQPEWQLGEIDLDTLPLADIFTLAAEEAAALVAETEISDATAAALDSYQARFVAQYEAETQTELSITRHPASIQLEEGSTLALRVEATGTPPLSYQWQKEGADISGATNATYTIAGSGPSDSGLYRVIVSDANQQLTSRAALVTIAAAPEPVTITEQPQGTTVTEGQLFSLNVAASGDGPMSFQWQKGGSVIPGATSASYRVDNARLTDAGSYRVIIENPAGEAISNFADIIVTESLSPVQLTSQPDDQTVTEGQDATFSITASGSGFLNYRWTHNGTTLESADKPSLTLNAVDQSQAGDYQAIVSNSQGTVSSNIATLTVLSDLEPVSISRQPVSQSLMAGETALFSVSASGDGDLQYQWLLDGSPILGAESNAYQIPGVTLSDTGQYQVIVSNQDSSETSEAASLTIMEAPSILVSWSIPTQREDGSPLELYEIGGYVLEYGYQSDALSGRILIEHANTTEYLVQDLSPGTLYMRIATVDAEGRQGQFSNIISVSIP